MSKFTVRFQNWLNNLNRIGDSITAQRMWEEAVEIAKDPEHEEDLRKAFALVNPFTTSGVTYSDIQVIYLNRVCIGLLLLDIPLTSSFEDTLSNFEWITRLYLEQMEFVECPEAKEEE